MRKLAAIMFSATMVAVLAFGLVACGDGKSSESSESYADEQFISDLGKALEARWEVADVTGGDSKTDENRERRERKVDAELSKLESYSSAKFEDTSMQEKAIKYINCLKGQKAALDYYSADYSRYLDEWEKSYDTRTQLIKDFVDNYGLTVASKYESTLKDLTTNATLVTEKESQQAAVDAICASMQFEPNASEYGHEYVAVVENTSGIDFDSFGISVNLLDADGIVVDSTGDSVSNWEPGQKAKFSFYSSEDFTSVSVKSSHWSAEG